MKNDHPLIPDADGAYQEAQTVVCSWASVRDERNSGRNCQSASVLRDDVRKRLGRRHSRRLRLPSNQWRRCRRRDTCRELCRFGVAAHQEPGGSAVV